MVALLGLFFLGGLISGVLLMLLIGMYAHHQEVKEAEQEPDPALIAKMASYMVEYQKLKEMEKK